MRRVAVVLMLSFWSAAGLTARTYAAEPDKEPARTFKDVGKGFKEFGKKVGEAGKEVGLEVADAAKKVWYKGKQVSKPRLDQVQEKTRAFWAKVIAGKDRTLEELRRENGELKKRAGQGEDD